MIDQEIMHQIKKALKDLELPEVVVELEHPSDDSYGDYSTNVAMVMFRKLQNSKTPKLKKKFKNPRELAEEIVNRLKEILRQPGGSHAAKQAQDDKLALREFSKLVKSIEVAGSGFINFWLSEHFLLTELRRVLDLGEEYGKGKSRKGKKIMVEFAHPNTHKQFHIGHMRNICLGESLVRLFEAQGVKVTRTNYQGDVGLHVAKALWGAQKLGLPSDKALLVERIEFLGKAYVEGNNAYETDRKAKKEIQDLNIKIYQGDKSITNIWEKTRKWSLEYFEWIYKRVYSKFDRFYFESEVAGPGKEASLQALKKGVLSKSQGAVVFDGNPYGLHTRVFLTKENLPTYEAKELGLAALEFSEFGKIDKCIHVVGPEQRSFFEVTFKVEELLDPKKYKGKQEHFAYGYVNLKSGKMSSRKGTIVTGEWLLDEAKRRIKKIMSESGFSDKEQEEIAEQVGVGAVKYSMLKVSPVKNIAFDFEASVNLEGDSGPYLQYTHARANSVLLKAKGYTFKDLAFKGYVVNDEEMAILRWLYRFPEVVMQAAEEYAPNVICTYLYELAGRYNSFYNKHRILQASGQKKEFRLALTAAVEQVLKNGLYLLGIKAPEEM